MQNFQQEPNPKIINAFMYLYAFLIILTLVFGVQTAFAQTSVSNVYYDLYWDGTNGYVSCATESVDCDTLGTDYPDDTAICVFGGSNDGQSYIVDYADPYGVDMVRLYLTTLPIEGNDYGIDVTITNCEEPPEPPTPVEPTILLNNGTTTCHDTGTSTLCVSSYPLSSEQTFFYSIVLFSIGFYLMFSILRTL